MELELLISILIGSLFYLFYKWATANNDYFVKRNILHLKPVFLVGNTLDLFLFRSYPAKWLESTYHRFPNEKIIGFFNRRTPAYMLRDLNIISKIAIKDSSHFENQSMMFALKGDSFLGKSLISLDDKKWRDMRSSLTPIFTSRKLRHMSELVVECVDDMIEDLKSKSKQNKSVRLNMKELWFEKIF
ncbi:probable cytochrome P450 9f2 isoform X3 [Contarinia nasturtii]|uniref:probable cytochrome P450 9f2 isoform X3 n=1 Tax=Contarinia nasturtii TaxID=265458 RepID=UPI0012D4B213|nr:probable cytochrome P450 9f2 isoform X3 [Contarinia nasturtii]